MREIQAIVITRLSGYMVVNLPEPEGYVLRAREVYSFTFTYLIVMTKSAFPSQTIVLVLNLLYSHS